MNDFCEKRQDLIDRYLKGEMSNQECSDFESSLSQDKQLEEQLKFSKIVKESVSSRSAKLEKMSMWENVGIPQSTPSVLDSFRKYKLWKYRWVASVAIILSLGVFAINMLVENLFIEENGNSSPMREEINNDSYNKISADTVNTDSVRIVNDTIIYQK